MFKHSSLPLYFSRYVINKSKTIETKTTVAPQDVCVMVKSWHRPSSSINRAKIIGGFYVSLATMFHFSVFDKSVAGPNCDSSKLMKPESLPFDKTMELMKLFIKLSVIWLILPSYHEGIKVIHVNREWTMNYCQPVFIYTSEIGLVRLSIISR